VQPVVAPRSIPGISAQWRRRIRSLYDTITLISPSLAARLALMLFTTPGRPGLALRDASIMARAHRTRVPIGGGHVLGYEWGLPAPAILLLHGWSSRAGRLSSFVDPLRAAGFRVVGIDAPGHGLSSGWRSNVERFRAALDAALTRFAPVVGIVAHSYGARAAVRYLACNGGGDVRAIAVLGMPPDVRYMLEQFKLVLGLRPDMQQLLVEEYVAAFGRPPERHDPHVHAAALSLPTIVVHDRYDEVAPIEHARAFAAQLPRGELYETTRLGHCEPLRNEATIGKVVEFLSAHCRAHP
jgi:pimeloyl-ACP methyl ester carboxylesterase